MAGSTLPNFSLFQRKALTCMFTSHHEVKKCLDVETHPLKKKEDFLMLQSLQDVPWSKINQHAPQSSAKISSKICPAKVSSFASYCMMLHVEGAYRLLNSTARDFPSSRERQYRWQRFTDRYRCKIMMYVLGCTNAMAWTWHSCFPGLWPIGLLLDWKFYADVFHSPMTKYPTSKNY